MTKFRNSIEKLVRLLDPTVKERKKLEKLMLKLIKRGTLFCDMLERKQVDVKLVIPTYIKEQFENIISASLGKVAYHHR